MKLKVRGGLGASKGYDPQREQYAVCSNAITRFGYLSAGLLEEVDATGIASGYRTIKREEVTVTGTTYSVICTTNGTGTKVYYKSAAAGSWTDFTPTSGTPQTDFGANVATDMVVMFSVTVNADAVIVGFGTAKEWHYSFNLSTTWSKNVQTTDRSEFMTKAFVQETGLSQARMVYAVSPATSFSMAGVEVYTLTDVNATPTAKTTLGPSLSTYVTSIALNDVGQVFIGTRYLLYSFDSVGKPTVVAGPFADPPADAGGQSDRRNFEAYCQLPDNSMLYVVEGYDLLRVRTGANPVTQRDQQYAPRSYVDAPGAIPRVNLPISALVRVGKYVVCALTANTSSLTLANQPGGTNLLQNTLSTGVSELYSAELVNDELVWHGSELTCTDRLRYMWYEAGNGYLYLCSGDSESVNLQQRRCYYFLSDPYRQLVGGAIKLSAGTPLIEWPPLDVEEEYRAKVGGKVTVDAQSLTSTQTCTVSIRPQPDHDTSTAFRQVAVFDNPSDASRGVFLPRSASFDRLRVRAALGAGSGTAFPRLNGVDVTLLPMAARVAGPVF